MEGLGFSSAQAVGTLRPSSSPAAPYGNDLLRCPRAAWWFGGRVRGSCRKVKRPSWGARPRLLSLVGWPLFLAKCFGDALSSFVARCLEGIVRLVNALAVCGEGGLADLADRDVLAICREG